MRQLICAVALLTLLFANPHSAVESRMADLSTTYVMAAGAGVEETNVPLPFDTTLTGSVPPRSSAGCSLGETQYTIQYPGGATRVKLEISVASPPPSVPTLFVYGRLGERVAGESGRFVANVSGVAPGTLYIPMTGSHLFEAGTYFIALSNCASSRVDFSIRATLLMPTAADTAAIEPETSFGVIAPAPPGSCVLSQTQYRVDTPDSGGPCINFRVIVGAQSDQNITLYARRNQRVTIEDGRVIADLASATASKFPILELGPQTTYFIAMGNCSTAAVNYNIKGDLISTDPPPPPGVTSCQLLREPNGRFVLEINGFNMREGATVTVGGVTPRKVKFIELEVGSTNSYKRIRVVKKFCGGLPGNVVTTNPGSCELPSRFFCNERCPD